MATGDTNDLLGRIKTLLPNGWFQSPTPILDTIVTGIASALATVFSLTGYARLQTRIATATDAFLDLISFDFFGSTLPRKGDESDTAFRSRIQVALFLTKATRAGMIQTLQMLTGQTPIIFEPSRPADTGGLNTGSMGLNVAGGLGSLMLPAQVFLTAYRPTGQGVPNVAGLGFPQGALNTGSQIELASTALIAGAVTDASIYAAIDAAKPAGTIVWTRIANYVPNASAYTDESGFNGYTDESGNPYTTELS